MDLLSSEAIIRKFEVLPKSAKREVADFIDFLIQKRVSKKRKIDKSKLLQISCWEEEDLKAIETVGKEINKWQLRTF